MRQATRVDRMLLWYWVFWLKVLPTGWLWEHGGYGRSPDGFMRPNVFGHIWLAVMSNCYYYEELIEGRIPEDLRVRQYPVSNRERRL